MNWDWEKLQEKRQRQGRNFPPQGDGPENPFGGFRLGDILPKFFGRGLPIGPALIVILLLWLASGIFIVKPGEVGVITRFGKYNRQVLDGPHYRLPYPFEQALVVQAEQLRTITVGQTREAPAVKTGGRVDEGSMFTGDENIVHMRFNVQYNILQAENFLFNVRNPEVTIKQAAEAAMREVVGSRQIDNILTAGREEVQIRALELLKEILDKYDMGVRIHTVQLLDVQPPPEVEAAFKDVANAREDKERIINEAEAYRNEIVPVASGTATGMLNAALAYQEQVERTAEGEAERFKALAAEYRKAPDLARKRLYLEAMNDILASKGLQKIILSKDAQSNILPLLNLDGSQLPLAGGQASRSGGAQ